MKKEYLKPEAELMKFVETEEIMETEWELFTGSLTESALPTSWVG